MTSLRNFLLAKWLVFLLPVSPSDSFVGLRWDPVSIEELSSVVPFLHRPRLTTDGVQKLHTLVFVFYRGI